MNRKAPPELPPLYAHVQPGLEPVAADEVTRDLGGEVKKTVRGSVIFRAAPIDEEILHVRTMEDVFLLAWGSDSLAYKAADLKLITQWTAKTKWDALFKIHAAVRPKPKGKPTYHIVTQMQGEHGYRRVDAKDALKEGLKGKIPAHWVPVDEDAYLEIWLTIQGQTATCGVRLTDRTMRHRTYKTDHIEASLRPTVAAAMVRLAGAAPGMIVLDPFCGAGTILAEQCELARQRRAGEVRVIGIDLDPQALYCTGENLRKLGKPELLRADARKLPLATGCVDRIISNPPFGEKILTPVDISPLYKAAAWEWNRVLKPGGRAVLLVAEIDVLRDALKPYPWACTRQLKVRVLGQQAVLSVWNRAE
ncbi:methyltransferase domain-containing protein [soil metagenome]